MATKQKLLYKLNDIFKQGNVKKYDNVIRLLILICFPCMSIEKYLFFLYKNQIVGE